MEQGREERRILSEPTQKDGMCIGMDIRQSVVGMSQEPQVVQLPGLKCPEQDIGGRSLTGG